MGGKLYQTLPALYGLSLRDALTLPRHYDNSLSYSAAEVILLENSIEKTKRLLVKTNLPFWYATLLQQRSFYMKIVQKKQKHGLSE